MQHTQHEPWPARMVDLGLYVPFLFRIRQLVSALESESRLSNQTIWDLADELVPTDPLGVQYLSQWHLVSEATYSASAAHIAYLAGGYSSTHDHVDCVIQGLRKSIDWISDHLELYPSSDSMLECDGQMMALVWQALIARVAAREPAGPSPSSSSFSQDSAATSHDVEDRFSISFCGDEHCDLCLIHSVPCSSTSSNVAALGSHDLFSASPQGPEQGDLDSVPSYNSVSSDSEFLLFSSPFPSPSSYAESMNSL